MPVALVCELYLRSGEQKTHSSPQIPAVFLVFPTTGVSSAYLRAPLELSPETFHFLSP